MPSVYIIWATTRENRSSGFLTKQDYSQPTQLQRLARIVKFVASIDMIFSIKGITKVLISLCACEGWSAPLFVANSQRQVSCVQAHILSAFL